jgi:ABC-2 type transport system permease protein
MLTRIMRHEWHTLTGDGTLLVVLAVFTVSLGYGLHNGARWVAFQQATLQTAAEEEAARLGRLSAQAADIEAGRVKVPATRDPRNPEVLGRRLGARFATMPPAPLAAMSIGQSDLLPYYFKVSTDAKELVVSSYEIENPHRLLVGRFDLSFAIVYIYPLMILALTYNLLSVEKEQGTLALSLSQPVALRTLVTGKAALRALLFLAVILVMSLAAMLLGRVQPGTDGALPRLGMWVLLVAAYGALWFGLAVVVASRGWASATNAMTLAGAWLVLVILLPSFFNLLATSLYPVPSRVDMIQAVREASDEATAQGSRLLAKYYEDHPELAGEADERAMNDFNLLRVAVDSDVEQRVRPVVDLYSEQIARQQRLIDRLRFLSPAVMVQDGLNDVAGTGAPRHRHFLQQVEQFHAEWRAFFVPKIFAKARVVSLEALPRFEFREEAAGTVLSRAAVALSALLLPAIALAVMGLRAMRRYPVTA